jgi:hypothetical protein
MVGLEFFERSEGDLTLVNGARIGLRPDGAWRLSHI